MKENISRRDIRRFEKSLLNSAEGGAGAGSGTKVDIEKNLLALLSDGGPELPAARRAKTLKTTYMERGAALRKPAVAASTAAVGPVNIRRFRVYPAFARATAVAAVVILLLAGLSFGSAYAMPGNPLYSVKRAAESVYLSLVPGDRNKADAYAACAARRLDELEYVGERDMSDWYYSLALDAQGAIDNGHEYGRKLKGAAAEEVADRVQALALRLESLFSDALSDFKPDEKANLERALERLRIELQLQNGAPSGPSQDNGQPQNTDGQREVTPGETNTVQEQQQQTGPYSEPEQQEGPGETPGNEEQTPKQSENNQPTGQQELTIPGQQGNQGNLYVDPQSE